MSSPAKIPRLENSQSQKEEYKLQELAGNLFHHCNESLSTELGDAYDIPQYPIQEIQEKKNLIRQMSK